MKFFCRAVEAKTFAAAAKALNVVPSAMSKTIIGLEEELGFKLINRSTRQMSLTEGGAAYYARCRVVLEQIEEMETGGREGLRKLKGSLRVGMHPGLRYVVLPELGRFLDQHVDLQVETEITNSPAAVIDHRLDLMLHIGELGDSSLIARRIGWTRSVACASPAYLEAWGIPSHPDDLVRHRAVIYGRQDEEANTTWTFAKDTHVCHVEVPVAVIIRDGIGLVDAAIGGCGIARPFSIAVRRHLDGHQLKGVLESWSSLRHQVSAVLPSGSSKSPAKALAFIDFFASLVEE
jgi:LysR family transcriptional regulator for bpeEF and oprC